MRPNPKSMTGGLSRLWRRVVHGKCVEADSGVGTRCCYCQLQHRVPYTASHVFYANILDLKWILEDKIDLWECFIERLTADAKVATVLVSIPASSKTEESEGR
jgi:hypothetical protein